MLAGDEDDEEDFMDVDDGKKSRKAASTVRTALEVAYSVLQSRIISSPNDMMGILLFGTEETKFQGETASSSGFAHCYLLMDLDIPDAEGIKNLKDLLAGMP
jgi:ATP-dependent DNA helicase 2 subunit 1